MKGGGKELIAGAKLACSLRSEFPTSSKECCRCSLLTGLDCSYVELEEASAPAQPAPPPRSPSPVPEPEPEPVHAPAPAQQAQAEEEEGAQAVALVRLTEFLIFAGTEAHFSGIIVRVRCCRRERGFVWGG